jgi:hypothetical protein
MKGLDYSFDRPGGAAIKDAGFEFVMRYVNGAGPGGHNISVEEIADLQANGLGIGLVFESTAGRMLDGYDAGRSDAWEAMKQGQLVGYPAVLPFFFACDFDAQPSQFAVLDEYLNGAASWLGRARVGVYGSYAVVEHCTNAGTARYGWQTYAWSGGQVFPGNTVYQWSNGETLNGAAVDYDDATGPTNWLWWPKEEQMADPRVDAIIAALTGDPKDEAGVLAKWNANGNSLLAGYAIEQQKLADHIAGKS